MASAAYARRQFAGGSIVTTIPLAVGSSDGSFTLAASTNWPDGSVGPFTVVLDFGNSTQEKVQCSSRSGLVVTVASSGRGYDGTSAVAHSAGCSAQVVHCAIDDDEANQVVAAVLGQSGAAKGDLFAMLSAAGPNTLTRVAIGSSTQVLGVSSGLPAWETPANGYGITGFAANPMTPAVSLTTASGSIGTNVSLSTSVAKIFDTSSLGIGTWLVNVVVSGAATTNGAVEIEIEALVDTATATLSGVTATGAAAGGNNYEVSLALSFIAVVTGAGTIKVNGTASTTSGVALAATGTESWANATGYTAIRIA